MKKIKITVERDGETVSYLISAEADIEDWMFNFASILSFLTYSQTTINEYLFKQNE